MKYPEHARRMKDAFNLTVFTGKIWDGHAVSHADGFDAPFCMIFLR